MKNFDSYYDPPEDPRDAIDEWLDGMFYDGEPVMRTIKLMAEHFNITQQSAVEMLIEWLKDVFLDLPDDFEQFDALDDVLPYRDEDND